MAVLATVFEKSTDIVARKIADEFILVPIRSKKRDIDCIYSLNEVAGRTWELIDGKNSIEAICLIISDEFDVSRDVAQTDVVDFVHQLEDIGSIKAK